MDGQHTAEWDEDISAAQILSPASSAPAWGVASWPDGNDVLLTYIWSDFGRQGYRRLPGAAPTSNDPQGATDPRQWIRFGEALLNFILLDLGSGGEGPEEWSSEYYDPARDEALDFHDIFRRFLDDVGSRGALPDFNDWLTHVVTAGTYERLDDE